MSSITPDRLPSYTDDEIEYFHPFFEFAGRKALHSSGLESSIILVHHKDINGITVDFSFERTENKRIVLLVEIKRTPAAMSSTRYRYQALSYRKEADANADTPYYVLTNLEKADIFKYDPNRPRVASQIIYGSPFNIGSFQTTALPEFLVNLERFIKTSLEIALNNTGEYEENLDKLNDVLITNISSAGNWHKILMPISYEYVRGASIHYPSLKARLREGHWEVADRYKSQPLRLREKGSSVDFENIFRDPLPDPDHPIAFDRDLLHSGHISGQLRANGEDLASLVQELIEKHSTLPDGPGIVETDDELARLLAISASDALDRQLIPNDIVCDPAAGTGRLLTAAHSLIFQSLGPQQWWANEINPFFSEPLCLRLGLDHANELRQGNVPKITIADIVDLERSDFTNVKVILMNPPFLSGIQATNEKRRFAQAIERVTGSRSLVNAGQIGLEALFLELVWGLAPEDAVIACILPFQILMRKSDEMQLFRRFLVEKFGLTHLISYPREGLFERVMKRTLIAVGRKNFGGTSVKCIDVRMPLERVDYHDLLSALQNARTQLGRAATLKITPKQELQNSIPNGWGLGSVLARANEWVETNLSNFRQLDRVAAGLKRGTSGNSGCSDLSAIKPNGPISALLPLIPQNWRCPSINNSDDFPKVLTQENPQTLSPLLPNEAWTTGSSESATLDKIINEYLRIKSARPNARGTQAVAERSLETARRAIYRDVKIFSANSVLIPRASRILARIGVLRDPYVVSTNFIVVSMNDFENTLLTASWLSSVFSQIQMEALNNDQEGMRKLEKRQIALLHIPDFSRMSNEEKQSATQAFHNDPPLNSQHPTLRNLDMVWLKLAFPGKPNSFLNDAFALMADLCEERSS
ncbi:MAG: BpuSI family type II restriction endonuclease [Candidatus Omnitrophica bacterium]|nr:BpuSI family type II restriction endonuclease [Candidatus Omnitrophota bacterium]